MLAAGCSTVDTDTVASLKGFELSEAELDDLLAEQGVEGTESADTVRQAISSWIQQTALDENLVDPQLLEDDRLEPLYDQGLDAAPIACGRLLVTDSLESGADAVERLEGGEEFTDVLTDLNIDPQLAEVEGDAGCFTSDQFPAGPDTGPEVAALFSISAAMPYAVAPTIGPDGTENALIFAFSPFDQLDEPVAEPVLTQLRETVGLQLLVDDLDVDVDSRYGVFDSATATVVPLG